MLSTQRIQKEAHRKSSMSRFLVNSFFFFVCYYYIVTL